MKERLDVFLVQKGYYPTRNKAQTAILSKDIKVNDTLIDSVSFKVDEDCKIEIVSKFKEKDELADRLASYFASIKVTADLLKGYYFKNFNADQVVKYIIKAYDDTMNTRALEENALENFKNFIKSNIKHFSIHTEKSAKEHQGELYGAVIINNKEQTVNVLKPAFDKFLRENEISLRLSFFPL